MVSEERLVQDNLAFSVRPEGMGGVQRAVFTFFLIEREREREGEKELAAGPMRDVIS